MECPKCGALRAESSAECAACGLIFAKWRGEGAPPVPIVPPPAAAPQTPWWLIAAVLVFVVLFGGVWTAKRRAARATSNPAEELDARMNAVNASIVQREGQALARFETTPTPAPAKKAIDWPEGLTEKDARELIEQCSAFTGPFADVLPRNFPSAMRADVAREFPFLNIAERAGWIELERQPDDAVPGKMMVWVRVTSAGWSKMRVHDTGTTYVFEHGRRRLGTLNVTSSNDDATHVFFDWKLESSDVLADKLTGNATLVETDEGWDVQRATILARGTSVDACK